MEPSGFVDSHRLAAPKAANMAARWNIWPASGDCTPCMKARRWVRSLAKFARMCIQSQLSAVQLNTDLVEAKWSFPLYGLLDAVKRSICPRHNLEVSGFLRDQFLQWTVVQYRRMKLQALAHLTAASETNEGHTVDLFAWRLCLQPHFDSVKRLPHQGDDNTTCQFA